MTLNSLAAFSTASRSSVLRPGQAMSAPLPESPGARGDGLPAHCVISLNAAAARTVHAWPAAGTAQVELKTASGASLAPVTRAEAVCGALWKDDETKAPACGRSFRTDSSVGWMGGATDGPLMSSVEQPVKVQSGQSGDYPPLPTAPECPDCNTHAISYRWPLFSPRNA
jgi:hypothetical protein